MPRLALLVPPSARRALRRLVRRRPHNLMRRDAATIAADVDYAVAMAEAMLEAIGALELDLRGLRLLELGPGHNFGAPLLLAGLGARVTLADRYLAPWDRAYHPEFYRALRARWAGEATALDRVTAADGHGDALTLLAEPAERLSSIPDGSIDFARSNAVLEHVFDLPAVCGELARITRDGGFNVHHVDFRWHRLGFTRPLDFLLHSDFRFQRDFAADYGESGNRWRASEVAAQFRVAGFDVVDFRTTDMVADDQWARFLPKLRRARTPYRTWPEEDLRILGARFTLRRTGDPTVRRAGADAIEAQQQRKAAAAARASG